MEDLIEEVGARLVLPEPLERAALLKKAGVSRQRLAADMGCSRVTVSRWVNGSRTPRGKDLLAFVSRLAEIEATLRRFG
jgi:transcriptional regulator with XRE-family HTH domain